MTSQPAFDSTQHPRGQAGRFAVKTLGESDASLAPLAPQAPQVPRVVAETGEAARLRSQVAQARAVVSDYRDARRRNPRISRIDHDLSHSINAVMAQARDLSNAMDHEPGAEHTVAAARQLVAHTDRLRATAPSPSRNSLLLTQCDTATQAVEILADRLQGKALDADEDERRAFFNTDGAGFSGSEDEPDHTDCASGIAHECSCWRSAPCEACVSCPAL